MDYLFIGECPFKCQKCLRSFSQSQSLKVHRCGHPGKKHSHPSGINHTVEKSSPNKADPKLAEDHAAAECLIQLQGGSSKNMSKLKEEPHGENSIQVQFYVTHLSTLTDMCFILMFCAPSHCSVSLTVLFPLADLCSSHCYVCLWFYVLSLISVPLTVMCVPCYQASPRSMCPLTDLIVFPCPFFVLSFICALYLFVSRH